MKTKTTGSRSILILIGVLGLTMSFDAFAVRGVLDNVFVQRTLVSAYYYGGCMAFLSQPVNSATNAPDCPHSWVTFSCTGTFTTQGIAYRMLDQAQLAKATGRPVTVTVDDTKKHNGFCFAFDFRVN